MVSKDFFIYSGKEISKEEIYCFVEKVGGFIQKIDESHDQGTIQNEKGTIWIHHSNDIIFEGDELNVLKNKYNIVPETSIIVSLGLNDKGERSVELGKEFCKNFLYQYANTVADNDNMNFFTIDTIDIME